MLRQAPLPIYYHDLTQMYRSVRLHCISEHSIIIATHKGDPKSEKTTTDMKISFQLSKNPAYCKLESKWPVCRDDFHILIKTLDSRNPHLQLFCKTELGVMSQLMVKLRQRVNSVHLRCHSKLRQRL